MVLEEKQVWLGKQMAYMVGGRGMVAERGMVGGRREGVMKLPVRLLLTCMDPALIII